MKKPKGRRDADLKDAQKVLEICEADRKEKEDAIQVHLNNVMIFF